MRRERLNRSEGFPVSSKVAASFNGPADFYRISGPMVFSRLVQFARTTRTGEELSANNPHGMFWFDQGLLTQFRAEARQAIGPRGDNEALRRALVELYIRFCLRDELAVSKDWTQNFDAYMNLVLRPQDSIIALVGTVRPQPYYSPESPHHKRAASIVLRGEVQQVVIDFEFGPNTDARHLVQGPFLLERWR